MCQLGTENLVVAMPRGGPGSPKWASQAPDLEGRHHPSPTRLPTTGEPPLLLSLLGA